MPQLLQTYLDCVIRVQRRLPLMVLDPEGGRESGRITLGDVYVGLNVKTPLDVTFQGQPGQTRAVTACAAKRPRLVIVGDPGSGKSTFLKFLAIRLAQGRLQPEGDWQTSLRWPVYAPDRQADMKPRKTDDEPLGHDTWPRSYVPVLITLRDFATTDFNPNSPLAFWPFIKTALARQEIAQTAPAVKEALLKGEVILLFDGVDEVPLTKRPQIWQAIGALANGPLADCPWIAACRVLSYNDAEAAAAGAAGYVTLDELDPAQIKTFVTVWFNTLQEAGDITPDQARGWTERLLWAATDPLRHLAGNPMLLTIMALVQTSRATLPQERVKLYLACVETLLFRWEQRKEEAEHELPAELAGLGLKPDAVKRLLAEIAWTAHAGQTDRQDEPADIPAGIVLALARKHLQDPQKANKFLNYTEQRAHLLVGRGGQTELHFSFPHRTFQEYLAARHLVGLDDFGEKAGELAETGEFWRTALLMAAEELVYNHEAVGRKNLLRDLRDILPQTAPAPGHAPAWQRVWRAGEMLAVLGPAEAQATAKGQKLLHRLRHDLAALLTGGELTPTERAAAGQTLAALGDPRPGVGLISPALVAEALPKGEALPQGEKPEIKDSPLPVGEGPGVRAIPHILWRPVPAGIFIMGDDEGGEDEKPACPVTLPAFQISQYPITNEQYGAFVDGGGYKQAAYWPEAQKAGYWQEGRFTGLWDSEPRAKPYDLGFPYTLSNHPVVGVSWYEAVAFCRWLTEQLTLLSQSKIQNPKSKIEVRLPTEAEWEKAARSNQGGPYPWGDDIDVANRCNIEETKIGTPCAVGIFPGGASSCGAFDMSGNVWEWCSAIWAEKAYPFKVVDEWTGDYLGRDVLRVLRGGAYYVNSSLARCASRNWDGPNFRHGRIGFGFRVVLPPM